MLSTKTNMSDFPATLLSSTSLSELGVAGRPLSSVPPLALEPRYMFDAAGVATGVEAAQDAESEKQARTEGERLAETLTRDAEKSERERAQEAAERAGPPGAIIVFVDRSVEGYESLIAGLAPNVEVIYFNPDQNGLVQMAMGLEGRREIAAIHVISHGGVGSLRLGDGLLSLDNLADYKEALAVIRASLSEDGDLLLYGCNVGADGEGRAFVEALAEALDADVAASDDLTGNQGWGGDWELETEVGAIETDILFSEETREAFKGVLVNDHKPDFRFKPGATDLGGQDPARPADIRTNNRLRHLLVRGNVRINYGDGENKTAPAGPKNDYENYAHQIILTIKGVKDKGKEQIHVLPDGNSPEVVIVLDGNKNGFLKKLGNDYFKYNIEKVGEEWKITFETTSDAGMDPGNLLDRLCYSHQGTPAEKTNGLRTFKFAISDRDTDNPVNIKTNDDLATAKITIDTKLPTLESVTTDKTLFKKDDTIDVKITFSEEVAFDVIVVTDLGDANGNYGRIAHTDLPEFKGFNPLDTNGPDTVDEDKPVYMMEKPNGEKWYIWARKSTMGEELGYHISRANATDATWYWEADPGFLYPNFVPLFEGDPRDVRFWIPMTGAASSSAAETKFKEFFAGTAAVLPMGVTKKGYDSPETRSNTDNVKNGSGGRATATLKIGNREVEARYVSGSGGKTLTFRAALPADLVDRDGIEVTGISDIIDLASNIFSKIPSDAQPAVKVVDDQGVVVSENSGNPDIDTDPPIVAKIMATTAKANRALKEGDSLTITVEADSLVGSGSSIEVTLNNGVKLTLYRKQHTSGKIYEGTYTVGDPANNQANEDTDRLKVISITGGKDDNHNPLIVPQDFLSKNDKNLHELSIKVDTKAPTITDIKSTPAEGSYNTDDKINIAVTVSEDMLDGSQIEVTLSTGATVTLTRDANDKTKFTGTYQVESGHRSDGLKATKVELVADSAKDIAGNLLLPYIGELGDLGNIKVNAAALNNVAADETPTSRVNQRVVVARPEINNMTRSARPAVGALVVPAVDVVEFQHEIIDRAVISIRNVVGTPENSELEIQKAIGNIRNEWVTNVHEATVFRVRNLISSAFEPVFSREVSASAEGGARSALQQGGPALPQEELVINRPNATLGEKAPERADPEPEAPPERGGSPDIELFEKAPVSAESQPTEAAPLGDE